jgi:hypothetical protein
MICCVTGMHRSGTSLAAQWLSEAGLPMDSGGDFPADISNPRGYREDRDFVWLHDAHLRRRRPLSAGWKVAPAGFLHFDESESGQAQELVSARCARHPTWGWKDPRTTLFLPDWKALLPDLKVIILWRPCAEVVYSLLTRAVKRRLPHLLIGPLGAMRLWHAYNRLACAYQSLHPQDTVMISATRFAAAGDQTHSLLATHLELPLAPVAMDQLFAPELLHPAPGWLHRLCAVSGSDALEARLRALSVSPAGASQGS